MNLRDLEYLVALAELGHFARAADRCHCTQSTLSGQIKRLEEELGAPLFERIPGGARLTPLGEQALPAAREALAQAQRITALGEAARDPLAGRLVLGAIPTIGPYLWPPALPLLRRALPQMTLLLREEQTRVLLGSLRDGQVDAGILALPVEQPGVEIQELWREAFVLAVPAGHPLAKRKRAALADLAGLELLLLDDGHCLRDQALAVCSSAGAREDAGFRATSLESLRQMVLAGSGATLLPASAARPEAGLALLPIDDAPGRQVGIVWRRGHPRTQAIALAAAALRRAWAVGRG